MADRAEIEKLILDAYAARNAKDLDAVAGMFKPDASFHLAGAPATFAAAVRADGETQLRATFSAIITTFDILDQVILDKIIDGNQAAVRWHGRIRHNPSGTVFETELLDVWTIDGGRIASMVEFCDTALVASITAAN